mmetsp:Transcript_51000/g.141133  ORF Transcript_51000/g.141133 Transcript_51000/m.141133 type:complete len:291 (-) Transcript_51000:384-1256(-)|eukprot:7315650-Prymnesium_polylepis.1
MIRRQNDVAVDALADALDALADAQREGAHAAGHCNDALVRGQQDEVPDTFARRRENVVPDAFARCEHAVVQGHQDVAMQAAGDEAAALPEPFDSPCDTGQRPIDYCSCPAPESSGDPSDTVANRDDDRCRPVVERHENVGVQAAGDAAHASHEPLADPHDASPDRPNDLRDAVENCKRSIVERDDDEAVEPAGNSCGAFEDRHQEIPTQAVSDEAAASPERAHTCAGPVEQRHQEVAVQPPARALTARERDTKRPAQCIRARRRHRDDHGADGTEDVTVQRPCCCFAATG